MNLKHANWLRSAAILLMVSAGLGQVPQDWVVDVHAFEHTMTITGLLVLNEVVQTDTGSVIAVFHGDECRGVAEAVEVGDASLYFLMVYANVGTDSLQFRAWDASIGNVVILDQEITFSSGISLGDVEVPFLLTGTNNLSYIEATNDSFEQEEDALGSVPFDILGNDIYDRSLAMLVTFPVEPLHGILIETVDQTFSYSSDLNFFGLDSFQYSVSHAYGSDSAWAWIDVTAVDDPLGEFHLMAPSDGSVFESGSNSIQDFSWELPVEVDGDPVTYSVYVYDGGVLDSSYFADVNSISLDIEELHRDTWLDWHVVAFDGWGWTVSADTFSIQVSSLVNIDADPRRREHFELGQNYPNPFNPTTTINYDLPSSADVMLTVYDMSGRTVTTLTDRYQSTGSYTVEWNGTDDLGNTLSAGVYLCRLVAGDYSKTIKIVYLR